MKSRSSTATPRYEIEYNFNFHLIHLIVICLHCLRDAFTMRCAILELEANLETFPVWFIFGGRLPQTRGVFSTVLLKSVAVCLYACRPLYWYQTGIPRYFYLNVGRTNEGMHQTHKVLKMRLLTFTLAAFIRGSLVPSADWYQYGAVR